MNTKEKNIYDDNVLHIVVQETPKTRTLDNVETALSLIDASVRAITDDISTLNTKTDDISTRLSEFISDSSSASRQDIEDVSTRVTTLAAEISDVSTRLSSHIADYVNIDADVSALKTLTAAQTTRLNGHDTSITSLSDGLQSANASISGLRNDVSATNNLIVVYDTSVRNHFVSLDASVEYLRTERNRLDASISSLTSYIDTTVTDILMTDRARINSIESLVIDTSVYVHDTLSAYDIKIDSSISQAYIHIDASLSQAYTHIDTSLNQINSRLDSSLNQFNSRLDSSLNQINNSQQSLISNWDERDVVIARALAQHDASILNLIARVTALENA